MGKSAELTADLAESGTERILAEVLADLVSVEQVPVDGDFFEDLGADSLVMAKFCARLRKRGDLPSVSMKDIYAHPTIRSLAESFGVAASPGVGGAAVEADADAVPTLIRPRDPVLLQPVASGSTRQYIMCGALQLLFFLGYA